MPNSRSSRSTNHHGQVHIHGRRKNLYNSGEKHVQAHRHSSHSALEWGQTQQLDQRQKSPGKVTLNAQAETQSSWSPSMDQVPNYFRGLEARPAAQSLHAWDSLASSEPRSTLGLGPLLFQAAGCPGDIDTEPPIVSSSGQETMREANTLEMDWLLQSDPISFNPLHAISWAKLEDGLLEEVVSSDMIARPMTGCEASKIPAQADTATSEFQYHGKECSSAGLETSITTASANLFPVSNMTSNPATPRPSPAVFVDPCVQSAGEGSAQQLKNREQLGQRPPRKHNRQVSTMRSETTPVDRQAHPQRQASRQPFLAQSSQQSMVTSHISPQHTSAVATFQPLPAPPITPCTLSLPFPDQDNIFLCLGPYCAARFPTETELNAHFRASHSLACSWASCRAAGFTSNNALMWHVKAEHLLLCPVPGCCDRVFSSKRALDGHVKIS